MDSHQSRMVGLEMAIPHFLSVYFLCSTTKNIKKLKMALTNNHVK